MGYWDVIYILCNLQKSHYRDTLPHFYIDTTDQHIIMIYGPPRVLFTSLWRGPGLQDAISLAINMIMW